MADVSSEMIQNIYRCASAPEQWPRALDAISGSLNAAGLIIKIAERSGQRLRTNWLACNSSAVTGDFASRVDDFTNPRMLSNFSPPIQGVAFFRDSQHLDLTSPDVRRLHRVEADLGYHSFIGARIELDGRRTLLVALYSSRLSEFDSPTENHLAGILPHLAQSLTLGEDFTEKVQLQQLCSTALDAVAFGLVICTPEGTVQFANRAATKAMDGSSFFIAGDQVQVENRQDRVRLQQLLAGSSGMKTMTKRFGVGHRALDVVAFSDQQMAGARILFVSRPSAFHSMSCDALCQIYGMTPAEAALATALATGQSIAEFAENRSVSICTARTQMRQVLAKTGTKGKTDLVRQIWTSAIAACSRLTY